MGTNYYLNLPPQNKCNHCGRQDEPERVHIGKHSFGWKFCFHPRFKTMREWEKFLAKGENIIHIYDEYGKNVDYTDFFMTVVHGTRDGIWLFDPRATEEHRGPYAKPGDEWLDDEGYRFTRYEEFS